MATLTKDEQIEEWQKRAFGLLFLLEDIEEFDELTGSPNAFHTATMKKIKQRHRILTDEETDWAGRSFQDMPGEGGTITEIPDDDSGFLLKERLEKGKHQ